MDVEPLPEAISDIRKFEPETREILWENIVELEEKGLDHENSELIWLKGDPVYRLKIVDRDKAVNHRVVFNVYDGKIVIIAVFDRDSRDGYPEKMIEGRK
ncbi:MAG: hypothetical protein ABEJ56_06245 [Candidatus Nanohaloarchaea archaeon]